MSAQVKPEPVTITITKPDGAVETLTTQTLANKTYSVTTQLFGTGTFKVKAHGDADEVYKEWNSEEISFSL